MPSTQQHFIRGRQPRSLSSFAGIASRVAGIFIAALTVVSCEIDDPPPFDAGVDAGDAGFKHIIVEKTFNPDEGGTIEIPDGPKIEIPAGALPAGGNVKITIETTPTAGPKGTVSTVYQFGPEGLVFDKPVPISMPFDVSGRNPSEYTVFWSNLGGEGYTDLQTIFENGRATAMVDHFSTGGIRRKPLGVTCVTETSTPRDDDNDGVADRCVCKDGFESTGNNTCADIDECETDNGGCDSHAECTNIPGGRVCGKCPNGFTGTGETECVDINECATANGGCDDNVECTNNEGGFTCGACPNGFTGGGASGCVDIDECDAEESPCDPLTVCSNTAGSFECSACPAGYLGNGKAGCIDVNECMENPGVCGENSVCTNTPSGYTCACASGFMGDPCMDIDECATDNGGCGTNVGCMNTPGGRICGGCASGYTSVEGSCVDINECDSDENDCVAQHKNCANTDGSYACSDTCINGYELVEGECVDEDECVEGGIGRTFCSTEGANKTCVNTEAGYRCESCPSGEVSEAGGPCRAIVACSTYASTCDGLNKECLDHSGADATCGSCKVDHKPGDTEDDACVAILKCADAQEDPCPSLELSFCVDHAGDDYTCEPCASGQTSDGLGGCRGVRECAGDGVDECIADGKTCTDHESTDFTCDACAVGYKPGDTPEDACVLAKKCEDDSNAGVTECAGLNLQCANQPNADYACQACPTGQKFEGGSCVPYDKCPEGADEDGGVVVDPCENQEGKPFCVNHDDSDFSCEPCPAGQTNSMGTCRDIMTCGDSNTCSSQGKDCLNHDDMDYTCGGCLGGYTTNSSGQCVANNAYSDCAEGEPKYLDCAGKHQECDGEPGQPGSCGACVADYVQNSAEECVLAAGYNPCADGESLAEECAEAHRICDAEAGDIDAECGGCADGYQANEENVCMPVVDPCDALACDEQHRSCEGSAPTECGGCLDGYTETVGGDCLLDSEYNGCAEGEPLAVQCAEAHQACNQPEEGEASCGSCLSGYAQDGDTCKLLPKCDNDSDAGVVDAGDTDAGSEECRVYTKCEDEGEADCGGDFRLCVDHDDSDHTCGGCLPGYMQTVGNTCVALGAYDGCAVGEPTASACAMQNRVCNGGAGVTAMCGDCLEGFESTGPDDVCMPEGAGPVTCDTLNCTGDNEVCVPGEEGADATCECPEGYKRDGANCVALPLCPDADEGTGDDDAGVPMGSGDDTDAGAGECMYITCDIDTKCMTEHRICSNQSGANRTCGGCLEDYTQNANGECIALTEYNGCTPGEEKAEQCDEQNRVCTGGMGSLGECGACLPGYSSDNEDDVCMPDGGSSITCESLDCEGQNKECDESGEVPVCGACLPDYVLNGSVCELLPVCGEEDAGPCRDIITCAESTCATQHRACTGGVTSDAVCGECLNDYTEINEVCELKPVCPQGDAGVSDDDAGTTDCRDILTCAESPCAGEHRTCTEGDDSDATCGTCLPGYREDGDTCVPHLTCAGGGNDVCSLMNKECTTPDPDLDYQCADCPVGEGSDGNGSCAAVARCETGGNMACGMNDQRCVNQDHANYTCEDCPEETMSDGMGDCVPS